MGTFIQTMSASLAALSACCVLMVVIRPEAKETLGLLRVVFYLTPVLVVTCFAKIFLDTPSH